MLENLQKALRDYEAFASDEIILILSHFRERKTEKGEIILFKGEVPRYIYFINKGYIRVFCLQSDGKEYTRFLAFEGSFATAFPGFVDQKPSLAFIDTLEASQLLAIHYDNFQLLLNSIPVFERFYRKLLEKSYVASILRIEKQITLNAKERYLEILRDEPHLIQRLPNRILANYMGITQESLSRLKGEI